MRAERDGRVARLAARAIGHAGMLLGAGRETVDGAIDPSVGFVFHKKVGDPVAVGEPIVTVHVGKASRREEALARLREAIVVAPEAPPRGPPRPRHPPDVDAALDGGSTNTWNDSSHLLGLLVFLGIAWALSTNRKAIRLRTVLWGLGLQFALALFVLKIPVGQEIFTWVGAQDHPAPQPLVRGLRVRVRRARHPGRRASSR